MKTTIYYFSGTGNSLKVAKDLSLILEDCEVVPMAKLWQNDHIATTSEKVGFVFPLHFWGLPLIVHDFIEKLRLHNTSYLFVVVTRSGDYNGIPLIQIERILLSKSKTLSSGFFIRMPNNYTLDDIVTPPDLQQEWFEEANTQIKQIANIIAAGKKTLEIDITKTKRGIEKTNRSFRENVQHSDKFFNIDENCNKCGVCAEVCPVNNILLVQGKPQWRHKCVQCLACLNYCPENSIQYGKKTLGKGQYHHPEITVKELKNQKAWKI
ncbi:MAG: EFR1 family ferrodoxin [Promethearchaeota archaeon]